MTGTRSNQICAEAGLRIAPEAPARCEEPVQMLFSTTLVHYQKTKPSAQVGRFHLTVAARFFCSPHHGYTLATDEEMTT
jgi:hypothetical protein